MRSAWAIALLLFGVVASSQAQTTAQRAQRQAATQKQLTTLRGQIKSLGEEQRKLEGEKNAAARELREIDGRVSKSQRSLHDTETRIADQEAELVRLQEKQQALERSLTAQRAELAQLVRSAYAMGRHEQLKLLLEQGRMSDLARALAYHRYFQQQRKNEIGRLTQELKTLADVSEQVRATTLELQASRAQQKGELDTLAGERRERGKLVSSLDAQYRDRDARIKALGRDEKATVALLERLRRLMEQAAKPPARTPNMPGTRPATPNDARVPIGPLNLPLNGSVLAGFGGTMPDGHRSQGLLIAGNAGAEVRAVSGGRVAYADWLKGYGLLIILDHGNGWMTLYAFNDTLLKNVGDTVRAGEAISTVGSSGGQGRPALYFELRRNGQPQDPRSWLKK
ncbi:murein hydrolase activator EnvC family protein [Arenimonas sp.]|uniref:murein hydrolase activator EnvC family protein n=1 Tax=Arenimonas sp. TaxID=1872635 RepID=UPI0039E2EE34